MPQLAALLLAVLGLLPIANWITGGHAAPWYDERLRLWLTGGVVVALITLAVGIALKWRPSLWNAGAWSRVAVRWCAADRRADASIALGAGLVYAGVARVIFSAKPLPIDEIVQLFQARVFAGGRLWSPAPQYPEFTSVMNLIDWDGKVYGQFPAGGPAMLAIGTLLHAEWLIGPVAGGITVYLLARLLRLVEVRHEVALAAVLLYAFAPFPLFLSGSMMNHVTTVMWLLAACVALAHATAPAARAVPWAALLGFCLGVAATIRPLDALAFAIPAGAWLLWRALRGGRPPLRALLASGIGIAMPIAVLLLINKSQTGHPLEFGYIAMWGRSHELGFHEAPWGPPHTAARGLELINIYLLRLQTWFLETPVPSLLFATGALALTRTLTAFDRYLIASSGLLLLAYFAYWHDGFYLGPRFLLPCAPWLALWTVRFPSALAARGGSLLLQRMAITAGISALVIGGLILLPIRAEQYRNGLPAMRLDADATAQRAGVHNAVVLVRESWGSQLYVRMWTLGVSRVESYQIFSRMDACQLELLLSEVERRGGSAIDFVTKARPIAAASHRLVRLRTVADSAIHLTAGVTIAPVCLRRIAENQAGFANFAPMLLAGSSGNLFVRDLHARDSLLLQTQPGRPVYLLVKDTTATAPLRLAPLAIDSAMAEWRTAAVAGQ